jgi:hypothetical protein
LAVFDYAAWAWLRLSAPLTLLHVLDEEKCPASADLSGNIGLGSQEHLLEELATLSQRCADTLPTQIASKIVQLLPNQRMPAC